MTPQTNRFTLLHAITNVTASLSCFCLLAPLAFATITPIELTPTDVGSSGSSFFSTSPTSDPGLFLGASLAANAKTVNFNTAPDGPLFEGLLITNEYSSLGVTMNSIRISGAIFGGNLYGTGFAADHDSPQIYTFSSPVVAVGIVNTSPDKDLVEFWSGPNATGSLLFSFNDQESVPTNFNVDRFVGGIATGGMTIGSFKMSNISGNLELDELLFVPVPEPSAVTLLLMATIPASVRRRRNC